MKQLKILFTLLILIAVLNSCDNENIKAKGLIIYYNNLQPVKQDTLILDIKCYSIKGNGDLIVITNNSRYWRDVAKGVRFCKPIY